MTGKKLTRLTRIIKNIPETASAMVTMIIITAVLMIIGAGMYFMATRQETMSSADNAGSQAFYYSEGGVENVLDILNYAATETQLTQLRPDQSPDGFGYLMDPDPNKRATNPSNPVQMRIGAQAFTVWVDEVDQNGNHCTGCGLNLAQPNATSYLKIMAEGRSSQGYRKLEQMVMLKASKYPLTLFVHGDADVNGNPTIENQNLYIEGNLYNRSKINVTGTDQITGIHAGVLATGSIYSGKSGSNTQIYDASGNRTKYWNDINKSMPPQPQYDRDSRGPRPPGKTFTLANLNSVINTSGLTNRQLNDLKSQAQASHSYFSASGKLTLQPGDLPSSCGNIVVYVEFPAGNPSTNDVDIKVPWPPSSCDPNSGKAIIIVKNASVDMEGNAIGSNFHGIVYSPDGPVTVHGGGGGAFTGFIWATAFTSGQNCQGNVSCVGLVDIGNFDFKMDSTFYNDLPSFTWTVTRMTNWTEVDR